MGNTVEMREAKEAVAVCNQLQFDALVKTEYAGPIVIADPIEDIVVWRKTGNETILVKKMEGMA